MSDPFTRPLKFHLDRVDAWLRELWAVNTIDIHASDGTIRKDQAGLLRNIREDVIRLRREAT